MPHSQFNKYSISSAYFSHVQQKRLIRTLSEQLWSTLRVSCIRRCGVDMSGHLKQRPAVSYDDYDENDWINIYMLSSFEKFVSINDQTMKKRPL